MISEANPGEGAGGMPFGKWSGGHPKKKMKPSITIECSLKMAEARMNEVFGQTWVTSEQHLNLARQVAAWLRGGAIIVMIHNESGVECGPMWPTGGAKKK